MSTTTLPQPPSTETTAAVIALPATGDPVSLATRCLDAHAGELTHVTLVIEAGDEFAELERSCRRLAIAIGADGPSIRLVVARADVEATARGIAERDGARLIG